MGMSQEEWERFTALGEKIITTLLQAMDQGGPDSELGLKAAELHREWLGCTWGQLFA